MNQIGQNFESFTWMEELVVWHTGILGNWNQMRQTPNNPWGYIEAGEYRAQIDVKTEYCNFRELGLNNGYLNFWKMRGSCSSKRKVIKAVVEHTPCSRIESSLQDTLKIPKNDLLPLKKLTKLLPLLANALIKKALNQVNFEKLIFSEYTFLLKMYNNSCIHDWLKLFL